MAIHLKTKMSRGPFLVPESTIRRQKSPLAGMIATIFCILALIGIVNLYSASLGDSYFYSQLRHLIFGLACFFVVGWLLPFKKIQSSAYWFYGLCVLALVLVLLIGHTANGSTRWLVFGSMTFQPSEIAKLAVAMVVARFFQDNPSSTPYRLRDLWFIGLLISIIFALIFKQPDLGTAGLCVLIAASQIAFLRIDWRSLCIVGVASGVVATLGWNLLLRPYQRTRVLTLLNPDLDPYGKGYNSLQSLVAVGSGQIFGKGFMQGTQTQLQFLPARHTDFAFSVFAEEQGFWAGALVFVLFGLMTYLALEVARQAKDSFSALLAVGIAAMFFVQFAINVAMVLGTFPIVGMPLPLFSHGGSSLLSICLTFGLLVSIHRSRMHHGMKGVIGD